MSLLELPLCMCYSDRRSGQGVSRPVLCQDTGWGSDHHVCHYGTRCSKPGLLNMRHWQGGERSQHKKPVSLEPPGLCAMGLDHALTSQAGVTSTVISKNLESGSWGSPEAHREGLIWASAPVAKNLPAAFADSRPECCRAGLPTSCGHRHPLQVSQDSRPRGLVEWE